MKLFSDLLQFGAPSRRNFASPHINQMISCERTLTLPPRLSIDLGQLPSFSLSNADDVNTNNNGKPYFSKKYSKSKTKLTSALKKVRFADDCGEKLEAIRVMTEPSDSPPKINPAVIRRYRKAAKAFAASIANNILSTDGESSDDDKDELYSSKKRASWKIGFTQPASEYVKFRESLEKNKVALENVMLRNDHCKMLGTIKVANISFEKVVFLRFSSDGWKSYFDRRALYQYSTSNTFDTFGFEIDVPMNEGDIMKVEFCICYATCDVEYWDSNNGRNYSLVPEARESCILH